MGKIQMLLSLIDILEEYLPVDTSKKYRENEIKEVVAYIRLYERLGGKLIKTVDGINIDSSFEISLRILNGESIFLKEKDIISEYDVSIFNSFSELVVAIDNKNSRKEINFSLLEENPYPGYKENMNPYSRSKKVASKSMKNIRRR